VFFVVSMHSLSLLIFSRAGSLYEQFVWHSAQRGDLCLGTMSLLILYIVSNFND